MSYQKLLVWQKSIQLVEDIYRVTKTYPDEEKFGLTSQIRRSAISIPSNIAEGRHRSSKLDYSKFLYISFASTKELQTQIEISKRLGFISNEDALTIDSQINEISKMLHAILQNLKNHN
jgi:four helix bundle protein